MFELASDILCIPASSVSYERIFSHAEFQVILKDCI